MIALKKYTEVDFPTEVFLELTGAIYGSPRPDKFPKSSKPRGATYFLMESEKAVATATIYSNSALKIDEKPLWMIGNFEALDVDCHALFERIESDAQEGGIDQLIGPMNGSTWQEHRFIVDQIGGSFLSEMTHPNYYPEFWKQNEFTTHQRYFSFVDKEISTKEERVSKFEQHFSALNFRLRMIDLDNFEQELEKIYELCTQAFKENVLYSEISQKQFIDSYLPLKSWLKEEYIWIAENEKNECIGFLFAFENKLNLGENELVVKTIARHPSDLYKGLGTLLGSQFMRRAIANEVSSIIHAFVHENNTSKNLSQRFNGECIRTYELFSKKLSER